MVRGLDYYTHTVVEWVTDRLGSQGTICAGGRYDGLVELLGGPPTPGAGFAVGLDRVVLLHEALGREVETASADVYLVTMSPEFEIYGQRVASALRDADVRVKAHHGGGKLKNQMRQADRSGARWAIIVGEDEVAENRVTIKWLREDEPQQSVSVESVVERMTAWSAQPIRTADAS